SVGPTPVRLGREALGTVRREMSQHPRCVERLPPVRLAAYQNEVARSRVHRQPRLDRVPAVVLLDQVVDRVEVPTPRELAPAPVTLPTVAHLAVQLVTGGTQPLEMVLDLVLDLTETLRVGRRADHRARVTLDARREVAQPPGQRLAGDRAFLQVGREQLGLPLLARRRPARLVLAHDPLALAAIRPRLLSARPRPPARPRGSDGPR